MKNLCFIALTLSALQLSSAKSVTNNGLKLKLRSQSQLEPSFSQPAGNASLKQEEPTTKSADPESDGTWIEKKTVSKLWPEKSEVPVSLQMLFAVVWILILAMSPAVLPIIDHKAVTTTHKVVGAIMLVVLFGGLYMFTQVIVFSSVHFTKIRSLTIIECIYFMSQVITTVGYGDIVPVHPKGMVFVALYVLGALFIIAMFVGQLMDHLAQMLSKKKEVMWGLSPRTSQKKSRTTVHDLIAPHSPSANSILISFVPFIFCDMLWVIFFMQYPGENKAFHEALYMSIISLTTVGFGAFTPVTEGGMVFAAFMMIAGSTCMVNIIGCFCEFIAEMNTYQRFSPEVKKQAAEDLRKAADDAKVSSLEFFRFIVTYEGKMTNHEVDGILEVFKSLDPVNDEIDVEKMITAMEVDRPNPGYLEK